MEKKKFEESMTGLFDTCNPTVNGEVSEQSPEKTEGTVKKQAGTVKGAWQWMRQKTGA